MHCLTDTEGDGLTYPLTALLGTSVSPQSRVVHSSTWVISWTCLRRRFERTCTCTFSRGPGLGLKGDLGPCACPDPKAATMFCQVRPTRDSVAPACVLAYGLVGGLFSTCPAPRPGSAEDDGVLLWFAVPERFPFPSSPTNTEHCPTSFRQPMRPTSFRQSVDSETTSTSSSSQLIPSRHHLLSANQTWTSPSRDRHPLSPVRV